MSVVVNWQSVIAELVSVLGTKLALSERTGISSTSLCELASGRSSEPRYSRGVILLDLHRKLIRKINE